MKYFIIIGELLLDRTLVTELLQGFQCLVQGQFDK